jgi:tetratricopeptide (TPR) repeat protein
MTVGTSLVEVARYEEAEQAFAKAIEYCPPEKLQYPYSQLGHLFDRAGDLKQAVAWHSRAIESAPDDATFRIFLGAVLAKQGCFTKAEEACRTAIVCSEGCIDEAYLNLGLVLRARERFEEAADCFREALRLDPDYRAARRALRDVEQCIRFERL